MKNKFTLVTPAHVRLRQDDSIVKLRLVIDGRRKGGREKTLKVPMIFISCLYYNKALTSFQILDAKLFLFVF